MLPEGHKPVCRACYHFDCDNCATIKDTKGWFQKCECDCKDDNTLFAE